MPIAAQGSEYRDLWHPGAARERSWGDYRAVLDTVRAAGKPTTVYTVYDAVPTLLPEGPVPLSVFNDLIVREAARARAPVLDLRRVCTDAGDYAAVSPIEPSAESGGMKIARAIAAGVTSHNFGRAAVLDVCVLRHAGERRADGPLTREPKFCAVVVHWLPCRHNCSTINDRTGGLDGRRGIAATCRRRA